MNIMPCQGYLAEVSGRVGLMYRPWARDRRRRNKARTPRLNSPDVLGSVFTGCEKVALCGVEKLVGQRRTANGARKNHCADEFG